MRFFNKNIDSFARELGLSNSTKINRLFQKDKRNGKYPVPSTEMLIAIRERFNVPVDEILFSNEKCRDKQKEVENTVNNINIIKGDNNKTNINQ